MPSSNRQPTIDHAAKFRTAIETDDFAMAQKTLGNYILWFQSKPRELADIQSARELMEWGMRTANNRRAHLAEELMLATRLVAAYGRRSETHTWRMEG